jgi:hypothetical protein
VIDKCLLLSQAVSECTIPICVYGATFSGKSLIIRMVCDVIDHQAQWVYEKFECASNVVVEDINRYR